MVGPELKWSEDIETTPHPIYTCQHCRHSLRPIRELDHASTNTTHIFAVYPYKCSEWRTPIHVELQAHGLAVQITWTEMDMHGEASQPRTYTAIVRRLEELKNASR